MTLSEFKAWFEGYTEGLEGAPTKAQFDRIKEKVKEITGTPVTYPVFVDHYWPRYRDRIWYGGEPLIARGVGAGVGNVAYSATQKTLNAEFDSHTAMYAIGKADAAAN